MARLHGDGLPHGFFAMLGEPFLRTYLRGFVEGPHAAAMVVEADGRVAGFVVGPTANQAHWDWVLRRRGVPLGVAGALALLRRPRLLVPFARTRLTRYAHAVRRTLRDVGDAPAATPTGVTDAPEVSVVAVLTHVAVDGALRGRGSGSALVAAFVEACGTAGADEVRLVTRADDGAGAFYTRAGWHLLGERTGSDGTVVQEFRVTPEEFPSS